jgi:hypothetical protein
MLRGFDEVVVVLTEADLGGGSGVSWLKKCILDKHANLAQPAWPLELQWMAGSSLALTAPESAKG